MVGWDSQWGSVWNSFDSFGPAPVSVRADRALATLGFDLRNLDDVGSWNRLLLI